MRVAIVGSCQAPGIRDSLLQLLPGAEVWAWHVTVFPPDPVEEIVRKARLCDLVITQVATGTGIDELTQDALRTIHPSVYFIPIIAFTGFHADPIYLFHEGAVVGGVHGDFHSQLGVSAYLMGLSPERACNLYNALVFAELGYFAAFDAARVALESRLQAAGFRAEGLVDGWRRDIGPFMYLPNHPHAKVIADLVHQLVVRAGLVDESAPIPRDIPDHLGRSFTWPVYEALGKRLGVSGSNEFLCAWSPPLERRRIPLLEYLREMFAYYETVDRRALLATSVEECIARLEGLLVRSA